VGVNFGEIVDSSTSSAAPTTLKKQGKEKKTRRKRKALFWRSKHDALKGEVSSCS
jgi:hypothetical protein